MRVGLTLLLWLRLVVDQRIGEHPGRADVDDPPLIFLRDGVDVLLAQEPDVLVLLQVFETGWIYLEFPEIKPDCPRILAAAIDEVLFFRALGLEGGPGQRKREGDGDNGAEK